jgi:chaperonin GroEL
MPAREITFGDDMTGGLLRGVKKVADVVRLTLGPPSRRVLMQTAARPEAVGDGASIAKGINLKDPAEQMGALLLRSVADAIENDTGDGCTTAMVLADALLREGVRALAQGGNRTTLLNEIERMAALVVEEVASFSETADEKTLRGVALTAANGDAEVGEAVAEAVLEFTPHGMFVVEQGQRPGVEREVASGFRIESGFISHYFITDAERREAVLDEPRIAVTTAKLSAFADVSPLMEWAAKAGSPLLVIAEDVSGEALATMVTNKLRDVLKVAAVRLPMSSPAGRAMAEDIATVTGTLVFAYERGESLAQASAAQLGRCSRAVLTDRDTAILGGVAQPEAMESLIRRLTNAAKDQRGADRDALYQRMGRLRGKALVLRVGAPTESEVKPKLMLVQRTLRTVCNAAVGGVVVGGGVALLRAAGTLAWAATSTESQLAARVVASACEAPMRQIVYNAGYEPAVVIGRVRGNRSAALGFNAITGRYEDLLASMVVDPTNVRCAGLRTAASVALSVLRAGASVREAVPPPRLTEFERKYAKLGGYIATQSLALPGEMAVDDDSLLAYALLRGGDGAGPLVAKRTYVLETGITRLRKARTGGDPEGAEPRLDLFVLVAADSVRCDPSRVQPLLVPAGKESGSVEFFLGPLETGGRTVEVEFFYQRVLAAKVTLAFDVAGEAQA